jgi:hypothetical protein
MACVGYSSRLKPRKLLICEPNNSETVREIETSACRVYQQRLTPRIKPSRRKSLRSMRETARLLRHTKLHNGREITSEASLQNAAGVWQ